MSENDDKPRGITTFTTRVFATEAEARAFAKPGHTVVEMGRLFGAPSEWSVMVPK